MTSELKLLGGALLSAMQKQDVEQLAALRNAYEGTILTLTMLIKQKQQEETRHGPEGLQQNGDSPQFSLTLPGGTALTGKTANVGAGCRHLAGVVNCTVAGAGIRALRRLTYADGTTIVERLEAMDHVAHRLSYALLADMPFRDCLTTVTAGDLGQGHCEVAWSATVDADVLVSLAGMLVASIPMLALYMADQKYFTRGTVAGALKG